MEETGYAGAVARESSATRTQAESLLRALLDRGEHP